MNVCRRIGYMMCFWFIVIVFCACGMQEEPVKLTEEQKARVEIICHSVDTWGNEYHDILQNLPMNHIYLSELDDGTTLITVGYLEESKGSWHPQHYCGVRTYAITDKLFFYPVKDLSLEWVAYGIDIDLDCMSVDEIQEVIEQSYLLYIEKSKK